MISAQSYNPGIDGLMLLRRQMLPSVVDEGVIYKENDADILNVEELQMVSSTFGYMIYKNIVRNKLSLMSFNFVGGGNIETKIKML